VSLDASIAAREPLPQHRSLFAAFTEEVRKRFAFLAEYGWKEDEARWPWVGYRTPRTRLVITLRPAADNEHFFAELWFEAASTPDTGEFLRLWDLYRFSHPEMTDADARAAIGRRFFPANNRAEIADSLERRAAFLCSEGRELLEDRPGLVEELRRERSEREQELLLDSRRPAVDAAFETGDWSTVVRELEPFEDRLKRSEQLKLDYARRRL
jgi:hypothetical protein